MKRFVLAVMVLAAMQSAPVLAQDADPVAHYNDLLAAAKSGSGPVDWQALRYAWADRPDFYGTLDDTDRAAMIKALNSRDWDGALAAANKAIGNTYFDGGAHMVAAIAYAKQNRPDDAGREKDMAEGIFDSIKTGDGLSYDTAFTVIAVSEEYDLMSELGVNLKQQSLAQHGDHTFDVMDTEDENGKAVTYYFNIDREWAAEGRMFAPKN